MYKERRSPRESECHSVFLCCDFPISDCVCVFAIHIYHSAIFFLFSAVSIYDLEDVGRHHVGVRAEFFFHAQTASRQNKQTNYQRNGAILDDYFPPAWHLSLGFLFCPFWFFSMDDLWGLDNAWFAGSFRVCRDMV